MTERYRLLLNLSEQVNELYVKREVGSINMFYILSMTGYGIFIINGDIKQE